MDEDLKTLTELGYEFDTDGFEDKYEQTCTVDQEFDTYDAGFNPDFANTAPSHFAHHVGW